MDWWESGANKITDGFKLMHWTKLFTLGAFSNSINLFAYIFQNCCSEGKIYICDFNSFVRYSFSKEDDSYAWISDL